MKKSYHHFHFCRFVFTLRLCADILGREWESRELVLARVCLSGVQCMSSCSNAEISHLSRWEWGRAASEPELLQRLLLIRNVGRRSTFSSRPRPHSGLNEFILLCGQQKRVSAWDERLLFYFPICVAFWAWSSRTGTFKPRGLYLILQL